MIAVIGDLSSPRRHGDAETEKTGNQETRKPGKEEYEFSYIVLLQFLFSWFPY
jgi:hypothetical protein